MKRIKTKDSMTAAELNALPKSARPIGYSELTPEQIAKKYAEKKRINKTKKDKAKRGHNTAQ